MELMLKERVKDKLILRMEGVDPTYMNALRRTVMNDVPTLAIHKVTFYKNSSGLYDEMIAHRLGLVVLKADAKNYKLRKSCKCEGKGCVNCESIITLDAKGPTIVYAEHLKPKDPKVKPAHEKTVIVKLLKDQELKIEAKAVVGTGKRHTKFIPGHIFYYGYPEIKINKPSAAQEAASVCPKNVFKKEQNKISVQNLEACNLCMACVETCGKDIVEVSSKKDDFLLFIESWGQLKPEELMLKAITIIDNKLATFQKQVDKIK